MTGVATSTLETFLSDTFTLSINQMLYVIGVIWPYLLAVFTFLVFYKVARSLWGGGR